jgi:hypothetical protein
VKIVQKVKFVGESATMNPDQITDRLGMTFDDAHWPSDRQTDPPRRLNNSWVMLEVSDRTVDEGIDELLSRIAPVVDRLQELRRAGQAAPHLSVVRKFDDEEGFEEDLSDLGGFRRLGGQHQLLSFHLDLALMQRLLDLGCELDVDEYG